MIRLCRRHCVRHAVTKCLSPLQRDFIVQTGDPTGTGRGGESVYRWVIFITAVFTSLVEYCDKSSVLCVISKLYGDQARFFDAEKVPRIKHRKKGTVSMVNNGNDQHGSQVNKMYSHTVVRPLQVAKSFQSRNNRNKALFFQCISLMVSLDQPSLKITSVSFLV